MATGAGEYGREMLRKPYIIGSWMYSNGVRVPNVQRFNSEGYSGPLQLDMERGWRRALRLLARRGYLPRRMRLLPHHGRI
jgi:hypothetical protein